MEKQIVYSKALYAVYILLPVLVVSNQTKEDLDVADMTLIGMYHQRLNKQKNIDKEERIISTYYDMARMFMIQEMIIRLLYSEG